MAEKVCVVVGAGPGVGLAVARRFGQAGFKLALLSRNTENLTGSLAEMQAAGMEAESFAADSGNLASLPAVFQQVRASLGQPSVLVYNVAVLKAGLPSALDPQKLVDDFTVNVAGALACAQQVIPAMRAAKSGTILFTGGGLSLYPSAQVASLAVGKAGIRNLTYSLGEELESEGIHVATVTISGTVQPGTHFDPDTIAQSYWQLHSQPTGHWEREIVYK